MVTFYIWRSEVWVDDLFDGSDPGILVVFLHAQQDCLSSKEFTERIYEFVLGMSWEVL